MSVNEVRAAQPDASDGDVHSTLKSGGACLLQIKKLSVDGEDYRVCFFFKADHLMQVTLNAVGSPAEPQFRGIVTALRAKYGKELSMERTPLGYDVEWLTPEGANVSVVFFNQLGALLNINYQIRLTAAASKL